MAQFERYLVYGLAALLQLTARAADFTTVWLLSSFQCKQIPQTWQDDD